ncbi:MAG: chemotaxis protein chel [Phenylobacterium sp.]|nr:MAG: chemotaxis protein chel [Phenylobacterium sp.]
MSDLTALAVPPALAEPAVAATAAELAKRGQIKQASRDFESSFLSVMMQQMFSGLKTDGPFGGGPGEEMFRSVMTDAMAKQMTRAGGIGVAPAVEREMLKLQGLK